MDLATILGKYIRHLRKQSVHNQRVHAFSISGVITVIITVLWLHFHYGFWSPVDDTVYEEAQAYEVRPLTKVDGTTTEAQLNSPSEVFTNFFTEVKRRIDEISFDFSSVISDKETFERKE
jgi:hypothetical protein